MASTKPFSELPGDEHDDIEYKAHSDFSDSNIDEPPPLHKNAWMASLAYKSFFAIVVQFYFLITTLFVFCVSVK